ncbi:MAG: hypothetical protein LBC02_03975 [Planctomycetaceae bacterium]|nr:hypothetical protein [Planctomycetaceae bacterium]
MFDTNVMVLGLLHVVTALPYLRIRLRRDCPKTKKNFCNYSVAFFSPA